MSLTDRDRKILIVIAALAVVAAYWFLLLSPKRDEASKATKQLTEQRDRRDKAVAQVGHLSSARTNYAAEYADLLRVGKAVPASVDMPSLLVQLDQASKGTGVDFAEVDVGARQPAAGATGASSGSGGSGSSSSASKPAGQSPGGLGKVPAGAGGQKAQSLPGKSAEQAGNSVQKSSAANSAAASQNGLSPQDTQTSQSSKKGGLPVGGGAAAGSGSPASSSPSVPGLDTVPLTFKFTGTYFELADFYHQLKRFVYLRGNAIQVKGRLMTIDGFKFANGASAGSGFGKLSADVTATVYLVPQQQGVTAGATPQAPAPAGSGTQAVGTEGATPQAPVPAPTAAAKP